MTEKELNDLKINYKKIQEFNKNLMNVKYLEEKHQNEQLNKRFSIIN